MPFFERKKECFNYEAEIGLFDVLFLVALFVTTAILQHFCAAKMLICLLSQSRRILCLHPQGGFLQQEVFPYYFNNVFEFIFGPIDSEIIAPIILKTNFLLFAAFISHL